MSAVDGIVQELDAQIAPLRRELERLESARNALTSDSGPTRTRSTEGTTTKATSAAPSKTKGKRGRPKGSGGRSEQALSLVTQTPGITIPQLAEKMGIEPNYLYRVMPKLLSEGKVARDGQGWHPAS